MTEQEIYRTYIAERYHPLDDLRRRVLDAGHGHSLRFATKEPPRLELHIFFDRRQDASLLYAIEDDLCALTGAFSFRIFPHYPATEYSVEVMREAFTEAAKIGMISYGFFNEAVLNDDGATVTVEIPFTDAGVALLEKTANILSAILSGRYSVSRRVVIRPSADAAERIAARQAAKEAAARRAMEEKMERFAAEEAARRASLPPSQNPDYQHAVSLFEAHEVERVSDGIIAIGAARYNISEPSAVLGPTFSPAEAIPLAEAQKKDGANVLVVGEVFSTELRENRTGDRITVLIGITDGTSSIYLRRSFAAEAASFAKDIKVGNAVAVRGKIYREKYMNDELALAPTAIVKIKKLMREDNEPEKRVELHLHTNMSQMDALTRPDEIVAAAKNWGHTAIGITDHGTVQAFPEIMLEVEKKYPELKVLYGTEAYFVNDLVAALYGEYDASLREEVVVFDIETTGLSVTTCRITEIGAVKVKNGEVIDTFNTFVNPEIPIPPFISEKTHITDDMVKDAPKIAEALSDFLAFIGDHLLVAHNANFDIGFIRAASEECGYPFKNPYLDTLALSRFLSPKERKHTLDAVADRYGLGDFNHHRACDDAEMLGKIYCKMVEQLEEDGIHTYLEVTELMKNSTDPLLLKPYHMIIYAKNQVGLKNLYKLISYGYLKCYHRNPRIPKSVLDRHREGLIIGSACEAGELYRALLDNRSEDDIRDIVEYYDYLEIQPLSNNRFLIADGTVPDEEALKNINRRIVALGRKYNRPVVATCDAHFLNREDEVYRKILLAGMKFADADRDIGLYLRTTREMLDEFAYLGEETAREVVITNTQKIADMIEKLRPIPEGKYDPYMEGAEEDLQRLCWDRAHDWYGEDLPEIVSTRLDKELSSIIKNGFAVLYMIAQKLVWYSESQGYLVGSRGSVGSSFVASMAGISEVNPLPPHYRCPKCKYSDFITDGSVGSGFDLPDKNCPNCGEPMIADGHDIPFETFLGFYGDKSPDIDLNFSGDVQGRVHKYTEELFGEGNVYRAGTIGTLADKTAYGYIMKYLEERKISLPRAEADAMVARCVGVKRTTGQHPGGIIVIPRDRDVYDFTPIQHPADDPHSDIITTHFQFSYLHDTILKLDELGHDMPTKYKMLERYTGISVMDVKMNDPEVYKLFTSMEPLGVTGEAVGCQVGTLGLPEMGTRFIQQVLVDAQPKNFADLMQISGLTHGTNVWLGNAQDLIKDGTCDISEVIGTRDGIMLYLIRKGLDNGNAFKIMEDVRKGKGLKPDYEADMRAHDVPDWYIGSCKKIKYMFPKAHAAAYVMSAIRLAWYKIYHAKEFYAAFLSVASNGFDAEVVSGGLPSIARKMEEIEEKQKKKEATANDDAQHSILLLVREAILRGVKFLPIDLYKSHSRYFLPEAEGIRMPFLALAGLGDTVANKIVEVREEGEIFSVEELRRKAGLSKTIVELLRSRGVFGGLQETDQYSFF